MGKSPRADLSGAYGDADDEVSSWPKTALIIAYGLVVGWVAALAQFTWLSVTSRSWTTLPVRHGISRDKIYQQPRISR